VKEPKEETGPTNTNTAKVVEAVAVAVVATEEIKEVVVEQPKKTKSSEHKKSEPAAEGTKREYRQKVKKEDEPAQPTPKWEPAVTQS
jgi:hypothetical protein